MRKSNLFLLSWALLATILSFALLLKTSAPRNFFSSLEVSKRDPQQEFIFLKQFVLQYFTYDSENFWQTQASLTHLMQPRLRQQRMDEIALLRQRSEKKNFRQTVEILNIETTMAESYQVTAKVISYEESQKNEIDVNVDILLNFSEPSAENPWSYSVSDIVVRSLTTPTPTPAQNNVTLKANHILTLQFPCAIETASGLSDEIWSYKIITTQSSEVQLSLKKSLETATAVQFNCEEKSFELTMASTTAFPADIYKAIPLTSAKRRLLKKKESLGPKERKSLENELNFIISE